MFTRKHYKAIAEIIRENFNEPLMEIVDRLADYFAQDNPRFDREKFLTACGNNIDNLANHPVVKKWRL